MLATGKHTEIVLTRGVGLHTIIGMTIDSAVGEAFDKAYLNFMKYEAVLNDEDARRIFIEKYNNLSKKRGVEKIDLDYFKFIDDKKISRGAFIEMLAKYGDPTQQEYPIGLKNELNADMSFTGLKTAITSSVGIALMFLPLYSSITVLKTDRYQSMREA